MLKIINFIYSKSPQDPPPAISISIYYIIIYKLYNSYNKSLQDSLWRLQKNYNIINPIVKRAPKYTIEHSFTKLKW